MSAPKMELGDGSLIIKPSDDVKMRFYRAACLADYPGNTKSGIRLALWMIEAMDWATGEVIRNTSVRRLAAVSRLSQSRTEAGLRELVAAGLIERVYMGGGRKGRITVSEKVKNLTVGTMVTELWSDAKPSPFRGHEVDIMSVPVLGTLTVPVLGTPRPRSGDSYPFPISIPDRIPASRPQVDSEVTVKPSSFPSPITSSPGTNLNQSEGGACARVAGATNDARVAGGTYDPMVPVAGFDGDTWEWVQRLAKIGNPLAQSFDMAHTMLAAASKEFGDTRVRGAILQLEAAARRGALRGSSPARALRGWARNIDADEASRLVLEASQPQAAFSMAKYMPNRRGRRR